MGISANNFVLLELIKDGSIMYTRKLQATEANTFDYTAPATGEYTWRMRSSSIGTTTTQPLTYSLDNLSIFYSYPYTVENCDNLADGYRFGFNTQEKDDEVYGAGNLNTALFWEYDTRLGRRWNTDPVRKPYLSDYSVLSNNPILKIDPDGDDDIFSGDGKYIKSTKTGNSIIVGNKSFSQLSLSNTKELKAAVGVVLHYSLKVGINDGTKVGVSPNGGEGAYGYTGKDGIFVSGKGGINKSLDNINNLKTTLYHEGLHKDFNKTRDYNKPYTFQNHLDVYEGEMSSSHFKGSDNNMKVSTVASYMNYLGGAFMANEIDKKTYDSKVQLLNKQFKKDGINAKTNWVGKTPLSVVRGKDNNGNSVSYSGLPKSDPH
jgi:hypothetical protein